MMEATAWPVVVPLRLRAWADSGLRRTPNVNTPAVACPSSWAMACHSTVYSPVGSGCVNRSAIPNGTPGAGSAVPWGTALPCWS